MPWFSLLPENLSVVETWAIRIFLLMGALVIGPWALLVGYDLLLYIIRSFAYEVPFFGGRARGQQRPRAPSLTERPSGHKRKFSFGGAASTSAPATSSGVDTTG